MDPIVDLAPGAENNPLASDVAERIRSNLAKFPKKSRDFRAIRGAVQVVAEDTGDALTMRFDLGRLTIHDGSIGIPSVTFCGSTAELRALADMPMTRFLRLPIGLRKTARAPLERFVGSLASGNMKIYGLASHPRLILRLARIFSKDR